MTYEEILSDWNEGRKKWDYYKHQVGDVAEQICIFFKNKLKFSNSQSGTILKLVPISEKNDDKLQENIWKPFDCVTFSKDGWAVVGLRLLLVTDYETVQFIIPIYIKYTSEKNWKIKFSNVSEPRLFANKSANSDVLDLLWQDFSNLIKEKTIFEPEHWLGIPNGTL